MSEASEVAHNLWPGIGSFMAMVYTFSALCVVSVQISAD